MLPFDLSLSCRLLSAHFSLLPISPDAVPLQGVALNLVLIIGYIPETTQYSAKHFVGAIEQWLICMEMLIIAICFYLVYPVEEFTNKTEMQTRTYGSTGKKQEEGTSFV